MAAYIATLNAGGKSPATINIGDLKENLLTTRRSKTDQMREGRVLFVGNETMEVTKGYKAAGITRGALFLRLLKDSKTATTRFASETVGEIITKRNNGIWSVKGRVLLSP